MTYIQQCIAGFSLLLLCSCSDSQTGASVSDTNNGTSSSQSNNSNPAPNQSADAEVETLEVGPVLMPCTGVVEMQCLWVKHSGEDHWQYFYDAIHGFNFQPGYHWTLEVRRTKVDNPPADASSLHWQLIRIIAKVPDQSTRSGKVPASIVDIEVDPTLVECKTVGGLDDACLRTRPLGSQTWSIWPNDIEGYQHTLGIASTLRVRHTARSKQAAIEHNNPYRRELLSVLSNQSN